MKKIILLGCGGHAKSVVDAIESQGEYKIVGFLDFKDFFYRGYRVLGDDEIAKKIFEKGVRYAFICVGYMGKGSVRESLYAYLKDIGFQIAIVTDSSAIIASDAHLGEGTFVGKNAVINANAKIGKMAIINTGAIVEHDCSIGAFSHISVGAVLCGNVAVGERCLIGAGTTVIQGLGIADNVIVGAGAVVSKNLDAKGVYVGIPAKRK